MMKLGILLFILSVIPLVDLTTPGILNAHDAPDHVARIANFYQSITEGNLVPRWAGNLNWGYGHPILMFLYPLPSYIGSFFHAIGIPLVESTKLVLALSYIASVLSFFVWASVQWSPIAGFVGALLYGFAPYRFVDLYVRGAIGEHMAFIFPPIIFMGLLGLARNKKYWPGLVLTSGVAGLLLSHNAVSLMIFPIVLLYGIYLLILESKKQKEFALKATWYIFLGFAISAFFWMPALLEGKYTLRDIVTKGEFSTRFVHINEFFYVPWYNPGNSYVSKSLGISQWIVVALALMLGFFWKNIRHITFIWGVMVILGFSLSIQTVWSLPLWDTITILQKFQFPWRFLTITVLTIATLGSFITFIFPKKLQIILVGVAMVAVITTIQMWKAKSYTIRPQNYYTDVYDSTTDTGESSPIWSVRFMESRPFRAIQVIEGEATVSATIRSSTVHAYTINSLKKSRIVENTLYFPGWRVFVDDVPVYVEFQDPAYRGLMTFWLEPGIHTVRVEFTQTKLRRTADFISITGLFILIIVSTIHLWQKQKRKRSL